MGCFRSAKVEDDEEKEHDKRFQRSKKILLLGTGESGKTTILKQMKILHINGFDEREKKEKIPYIKQNIHESIYDIVDHMEKINPPETLADEGNRVSAEFILNLGPKTPEQFTEEYYEHVKRLWADAGVQKTYQRSNEYQLIDSAFHFLNRIDEIQRPDYIPTLQDILFCRVITLSITETEFSVPLPKPYGGFANFLMYDVGGQRGQRKRWIQVFDGINAILFLIAASDFDQTLREDESKNRLHDAFEVFKDISCSRFVRDAAMIVFLNKQDVLKRKIEQGHKVEDYFPQYRDFHPKEAESEYDRARLFMSKTINDIAKMELISSDAVIPGIDMKTTVKLPPRDVFIHYTIATDTNNIKKVFESVQEKLLTDVLKQHNVL